VSGRERVECICCRAQTTQPTAIANEQIWLVRQTAHAMFSWPSGRLPVWSTACVAVWPCKRWLRGTLSIGVNNPLAKQQRHGPRDPTIPQNVSQGPATRVYGKRPVSCACVGAAMTPWESLEAHGHVLVNAIAVVFPRILTSLSPMGYAAWPMVDGVADMSSLVPWLRPMAASTSAHDGSDSKLVQRPAIEASVH
jgi:hypothetical protein